MSDTATLLQIDLQNLFYAAKSKGQRIDFEKMWDHFSQRDSEFMTDAIVYMIRSPEFNTSKFETKLKSIGYTLRIKNSTKTVRKGEVIYKANQDVAITVECIDKLNTFNKLILMSGDGDFSDLCIYLKKKRKKIEIWSFKDCYNSDLERYADKIHMIENEFFYNPKVSVFGFNWGGPNNA